MLEQKLDEMKVHALPDQWCMLIVTPGKEQDARDSFHRYGIQAYGQTILASPVGRHDRASRGEQITDR
jgi:hypothetical protein